MLGSLFGLVLLLVVVNYNNQQQQQQLGVRAACL